MAIFGSSITTLIFLDETRLVRCDVDTRRQQIVSLRIRPRPLEGDWGTLVELALQQESKRARRVWVLVSEAWSQKIAVAGITVEGLSPSEAARALAFEAESFSGIPAFDSELSFLPLSLTDGLREFWVTQIPRAARDRLDQVIRERGGKLMGILHPAGMPLSLGAGTAAWSRWEAWPGLNLAVSGQPGVNPKDSVTYRMLNLERRNPAVDSPVWQELLVGTTGVALPEAQSICRLAVEEDLSRWLMQWGVALEQGVVATPMIRPEPKPLGKEVYVAAALCMAGIVAGLAFADHKAVSHQIQQGNEEITRLNAEKEALTNLTKSQETLKMQLKKLNTENAKLSQAVQAAQSATEAHRERWKKLLEVLAKHSSTEMVVQEIAASSGILEIRGKCVGTDAAHDFATRVAAELRPYGWLLSPSQKAIAASEIYDFAWSLQEVPPELRSNRSTFIAAKDDTASLKKSTVPLPSPPPRGTP
jgi:hypothetical protein